MHRQPRRRGPTSAGTSPRRLLSAAVQHVTPPSPPRQTSPPWSAPAGRYVPQPPVNSAERQEAARSSRTPAGAASANPPSGPLHVSGDPHGRRLAVQPAPRLRVPHRQVDQHRRDRGDQADQRGAGRGEAAQVTAEHRAAAVPTHRAEHHAGRAPRHLRREPGARRDGVEDPGDDQCHAGRGEAYRDRLGADGCRVRTISVANATTPTTTTNVAPSDSVTRSRPSRRTSWPDTPATKPAAATYAERRERASRGRIAATSEPRRRAAPPSSRPGRAGGRGAIVQARTNSAWTPKMMTAYGTRSMPRPAVWAPKYQADRRAGRRSPRSPVRAAAAVAAGRRLHLGRRVGIRLRRRSASGAVGVRRPPGFGRPHARTGACRGSAPAPSGAPPRGVGGAGAAGRGRAPGSPTRGRRDAGPEAGGNGPEVPDPAGDRGAPRASGSEEATPRSCQMPSFAGSRATVRYDIRYALNTSRQRRRDETGAASPAHDATGRDPAIGRRDPEVTRGDSAVADRARGRAGRRCCPPSTCCPTRCAPPHATSARSSAGPSPDVVLVDARTELAEARATCRMLHATGLRRPADRGRHRGRAGRRDADWGIDDVILASAGPAEVEARLRLAVGRLTSADRRGRRADPRR